MQILSLVYFGYITEGGYHIHEKADKVTGIIKPDGRGKHCNHHRVSSEGKENVLTLIKYFPLVHSHCCRAKPNKKYLESGLNIEKMYDLYKRYCIENERPFVKSSYYRFIFNTCFNIGFNVPKTDGCERCEEMKIKTKEGINITNEELHDAHIVEKDSIRKEKKNDKSTIQENELSIVFDLENVINVPKAEVGSFFYKRKLNLFNLTAIASDKQGY